MQPTFDLVSTLDKFISKTAEALDEFPNNFEPQTRAADQRFGDFQANGVLPHAKKTGKQPGNLLKNLSMHYPHLRTGQLI